MAKIKITCPNCGKHLEADKELAGEEMECPECGQHIIVENLEHNSSESINHPSTETAWGQVPDSSTADDNRRKWWLAGWLSLAIITIAVISGGTVFLIKAKTVHLQALKRATEKRNEAKREANDIVAHAKREINKSRKQKIKEMGGFREYPSGDGWVHVNKKYLKKFRKKQGKVYFVFKNTSNYGTVKPSCEVVFYDSFGVTTGWSSVTTLFIGLEAGQTRKEEEIIAGKISEKPTSFYKVNVE